MVKNPTADIPKDLSKIKVPRDVIVSFGNKLREIQFSSEDLGRKFAKIGLPKHNAYGQYLNAKKPKNYEFHDSDITVIRNAVWNQLGFLLPVKRELNADVVHLKGRGKVNNVLRSMAVYVNELYEILDNQFRVLNSRASNRIKTTGYLDLFEEEIKVEINIAKVIKGLPSSAEVKKEFLKVIKKKNPAKVIWWIIKFLVVGVVTFIFLPETAIAAPTDIDVLTRRWNNVFDTGNLMYIPAAIWWVFQWVGTGVEWAANNFPGSTGLAHVMGFIYTVRRVWRARH